MRCHQAREQLSDHLERNLRPPQEARLESHLRTCAACRSELSELQQNWQALSRMPRAEPPPGAYTAVMLRVQRERANRLAAERRRVWRWTNWIWRLNPLKAAGMAAAAAALALGVLYFPRVSGLIPAGTQIAPRRVAVVQTPRVEVAYGEVVGGQIPVHVTLHSETVLTDAVVTGRQQGGPWSLSGKGTISPEQPGKLVYRLRYAPGQVTTLYLTLHAPGVNDWQYAIITPLGPRQSATVSLALEDVPLQQALSSVVAQTGLPVIVDGGLDQLVTLQVSDVTPLESLKILAAQTRRRLVAGGGLQLVSLP